MDKVLIIPSHDVWQNGPNHGKIRKDFYRYNTERYVCHTYKWYQCICGIFYPLSFRNVLCKHQKNHFPQNAPSVVDLESPCRFIWRPGDRISAAPAILNMSPCGCVNGVTVWGKFKDTIAKITIMQNQFPCINQQIHWSYYGHDHVRLF